MRRSLPARRRPGSLRIDSTLNALTAVCDQLPARDKARLGERLGRVSEAESQALSASLRAILAL
jgi:mRNA-degrading endonuclease toxin of MazEF toxin-antitoxin module